MTKKEILKLLITPVQITIWSAIILFNVSNYFLPLKARIVTTAIYAVIILTLTARILWVARVRTRLVRDDYFLYKQLPSFDRMVFEVWKWDVERFLK